MKFRQQRQSENLGWIPKNPFDAARGRHRDRMGPDFSPSPEYADWHINNPPPLAGEIEANHGFVGAMEKAAGDDAVKVQMRGDLAAQRRKDFLDAMEKAKQRKAKSNGSNSGQKSPNVPRRRGSRAP